VLEGGLREPSGPWGTLHGADHMGRAVEVPEGLDEGKELRSARERACGGAAFAYAVANSSVVLRDLRATGRSFQQRQ
jgi:hypothetical protein